MATKRQRAVTFSDVQSQDHIKNKLKNAQAMKVDENFYKRIIELENEIQLSPKPSLKLTEELGKLYEKAIESFTELKSRQKVQFFKNKLTKLLVGINKLKKQEEKEQKPTNWSKCMSAHKKNKNKFMLFLQVETNKKEANNILEKKEKNLSEGYNKIRSDLSSQENQFQERKKNKKKMKRKDSTNENNENKEEEINDKKGNNIYTSVSHKIKGRNAMVDSSLNDFMKKLHYTYVHSKIFETPIETLNEILDATFQHKISKYYYYQDQIKQFELMLKDSEKDGGQRDEGIEFMVKDLQNERKSYYMSLETLVDQTRNKIKEKCAEISNEDKNTKKYLDELMNNISKIFIK